MNACFPKTDKRLTMTASLKEWNKEEEGQIFLFHLQGNHGRPQGESDVCWPLNWQGCRTMVLCYPGSIVPQEFGGLIHKRKLKTVTQIHLTFVVRFRPVMFLEFKGNVTRQTLETFRLCFLFRNIQCNQRSSVFQRNLILIFVFQ